MKRNTFHQRYALLPRFVLLEDLRYNSLCSVSKSCSLRLLQHPRPSVIDINGFSSDETAVGEELAIRPDNSSGMLAGDWLSGARLCCFFHKIVNDLVGIWLIASRTHVNLLRT